MPNRKRTPIEKISVTDYDLIPSEQITAGMLKLYFIKEPEKSKQALEHIVKNRTFILNLKNPSSKPILLQTDIDGAKLAEMIDTAKAYASKSIAQKAAGAADPTLEFVAGLAISEMDGKETVFNASVEFLDFLTDCCMALFR